jgi:GNAT superfamily N-acetyltransferase
MNGREVRSLTLDRLGDLPDPCRGCLFWERDPVHARRAQEHGDPAQDKESWLSAALLEWGSVGRIAYVDGQPVGYVTYAPAHLVPRVTGFPTAPVSGDAVLLMTAAVSPEHAGQGLGRVLVQAAAKDLHRRDIRAMEAFGRFGAPAGMRGGCVLPADFLSAVGFKTVREHPVWPRMRLDLRTMPSWREDVEAAIDRLRRQVLVPALSRGRDTGRTGVRRRPGPGLTTRTP